MNAEPGPEDELDWARRQLVAIDDQLRSVPSDDFARRHALHEAADAFRSVLRDGNYHAVRAAQRAWSERAGRKGTHEVDVATLEGLVRSMMPAEGR